MSLFMDLQPGQALEISGPATLHIEEKTGRRIRLRIEAEKSVKVKRLTDGHTALINQKAQEG